MHTLQVLSAAVGISGEEFTIEQQVAIAVGISVGCSILNAMRVDQMGWINNFTALWQVSSTIAIVICILLYPKEHSTNAFVWSSTINYTGYTQFGYVALLGLLTSNFSFIGYEAGSHMAEETTHASKVGNR